MARRRHRHYSPEFKAEALRVVQQSDEPMATIARNLGVNKTTLLHWVEAARPEPRDPLTEDEQSELQRLRREVRQLRMERDILKKATAFFARHSE
jgi:transposase